jgi:hypothetical protein
VSKDQEQKVARSRAEAREVSLAKEQAKAGVRKQAAEKAQQLKNAPQSPAAKRFAEVVGRQKVGDKSTKALGRLQEAKGLKTPLPAPPKIAKSLQRALANSGKAVERMAAEFRSLGKAGKLSSGPDIGQVKKQIEEMDVRKIPGAQKSKPLPSREQAKAAKQAKKR